MRPVIRLRVAVIPQRRPARRGYLWWLRVDTDGPGWTAQIGTSIGIALHAADTDAQGLLKQADNAMYHAKTHAKNTYRFAADPVADAV